MTITTILLLFPDNVEKDFFLFINDGTIRTQIKIFKLFEIFVQDFQIYILKNLTKVCSNLKISKFLFLRVDFIFKFKCTL